MEIGIGECDGLSSDGVFYVRFEHDLSFAILLSENLRLMSDSDL